MAGTVLLVEDEENLASLVQAYLAQEGYRVRTTGSGVEALRIFEAERVRLVVLDLSLPDVDGIEVCRELRRRSSVPIVMLTARDAEQDRLAGLESGADDYIGKPFSPRELVARMKAVLRRPERARGRGRGQAGRAAAEGVRPARLPRPEPRRRLLARPAARARVGPRLRRRHPHGRRPRRPAPAQARPARPDPDDARRRLQGGRVVSRPAPSRRTGVSGAGAPGRGGT